MKGNLRVILGRKDDVETMQRRLGEQSVAIGNLWADDQIGPKGERKLINAFHRLLPGLPESVITIVGPLILVELGQKVDKQGRL